MLSRSSIPFCLLFLFFSTAAAGQGSPLPVGDENYNFIKRLTIRYGFEGFGQPATELHLEPLNRASLVQLAKTYDALYGDQLTKVDRYRLQGFYDDNNEWLSVPTLLDSADVDQAAYYLGDDFAKASAQSPLHRKNAKSIFNLFYPTPANLLEVNEPNFYLRLNPIIDFRFGKQMDDAEDYFFNRRGLSLRAGVDDRFFLHFDILETQVGLPNYVRQFRDRFRALPGAGFLKNYTLDVANVADGNDFLNGQGYVSVDISKHIGARLGYGTHFIGDGERSLLLSNFSNNYPYLELNWRIWKFHYRNVFAELTNGPSTRTPTGIPLPKKYMAAHYLSINIGKRFNLGLFESVVLNRDNGFDLAYLNPIILYRTVEQSVGSPDNALVGLTARYRTPWRIEAYGQFTLDEFKFDELFTLRRGWWANKWGYQIGAQYVDAFGLGNLDLRIERNTVRPYTYTHRGASSYTHFGMALAHPLGANFNENLLGLDYRPLPRLHLRARLYLIEQGEGTPDRVVGENLNQPHTLREMNFGNEIGQGIAYNSTILTLLASYELYPNFWLEGQFLSRSKDSELASRDLETTVVNLGVRWNIFRQEYAF